MKLRLEIADLLGGLLDYGTNVSECLSDAGGAAASSMEDYAKNNRPWTDRTGNARRTMEGVCAWAVPSGSGRTSGNILTVGVEGHMPYSVFLELGYGQKYSILAPTVHHFAPRILLEFAAQMGGMG
ncbi:MAG: HK97 gp10 family phage protein [Clostridia bacterium]|nr:HK97 gp10 family phage protein [Clostridia bacterium]